MTWSARSETIFGPGVTGGVGGGTCVVTGTTTVSAVGEGDAEADGAATVGGEAHAHRRRPINAMVLTRCACWTSSRNATNPAPGIPMSRVTLYSTRILPPTAP